MRRKICGLMLVLTVLSCTKWADSRRPLPELLPEEGKRHSQLRLQRANGSWVTANKPRLRNDSIFWREPKQDETTGAPVSDITAIQIRQGDAVKTTLLVVGGALVVAAIAATIAAATMDLSSFGSGGSSGDGGGTTASCPLVYSWDGTGWRLDSGTFGGAITHGLQRTDVDLLEHLRPDHDRLRLRVINELSETDHIDRLRLLAVDHAPGTLIAPDPEGGIHTLHQLSAPIGARDFAGRDALEHVSHRDALGWESSLILRDTSRVETARDGLELRFHRPAGASEAHLVLDGNNTMWATWLLTEWLAARGPELNQWYQAIDQNPTLAQRVRQRVASEAFLQVSIRTRHGWEPQGIYWEAGPEVSKRQVMHLDLRDVVGSEIVLRLESPPSFWWIDAVALEAAHDDELTVTTVAPSQAKSYDGGDPRMAIDHTDGQYLTLETGQWIELDFAAPAEPDHRTRSYLLDSNGWYRLHTVPRPVADQALLHRVDTEPGAISRISTGRLNQAIAALSGPR